MSKVLCIIQARMGSSRLPGKILKVVNGKSLLANEIERVRRAKRIATVVVATSTAAQDDDLEAFCRTQWVECFRGSELDVLGRYAECSRRYPEYNTIVRICGDCPLIDPEVIDGVIELFEKQQVDFASNVAPPTFPDGMDVEVMTREILEQADQQAVLPSEREHVTQYLHKNSQVTKANLAAVQDDSQVRLTVDNPEDFEVISFLMQHTPANAGYREYVAMLAQHPEVLERNRHIQRNEGLKKSLQADEGYQKKHK